jgi:hypothetical protein
MVRLINIVGHQHMVKFYKSPQITFYKFDSHFMVCGDINGLIKTLYLTIMSYLQCEGGEGGNQA